MSDIGRSEINEATTEFLIGYGRLWQTHAQVGRAAMRRLNAT
jgi:hypothetical protein